MCKRKSQGGHRCACDQRKRVDKLTTTLEEKEARLEELKKGVQNRDRRRAIKDLEATIERKRAYLLGAIADVKAAEEREEAERLAKAELEYLDENEVVEPSVGNDTEEDNRDLYSTVTPSEMETIDTDKGMLTRTQYIADALATEPRVLGNSAAQLARQKNTKKEERAHGRWSTVRDEKRTEKLNARGVGERAEMKAHVTAMATAYGLSSSDYVRRMVLGLDLISVEGHTNKEANEKRLKHFEQLQAEAGITEKSSTAEIKAFYLDFHAKAYEASWGSVEEANVVEYLDEDEIVYPTR